MLLFLDSANTVKIKECLEYFPLDGITTNPTILARECRADLAGLLAQIRGLAGDKLLFVQVTSPDCDGMLADAQKIKAAVGGRLCIKIPATAEGLKALRILHDDGFMTTATAVYTPCQALTFGLAGADFVAPYLTHIDNMAIDCAAVVREMSQLFQTNRIPCSVLGASFRTAEQVNRVISAGAGAVTVAPEMLFSLVFSQQTGAELDAFNANWKKVYGEKQISDLL